MENSTGAATRPPLGIGLDRELPGWMRVALDGVGIALLALFLTGFAQRSVNHQGDLETYLLAAQVARGGQDPYRPEALAAVAGRRVQPFIYPPVALLPFMAVVDIPRRAVAAAWMGGKLALLAILVFAWARWITRNTSVLALALVAAFGWNASAQWDLKVGNVAIVEVALVWAAFVCFAAGRRFLMALFVLAAACFKLTPALFLLLLLVPTERSAANPRLFLGALAAFVLIVAGPIAVGPAAHYQHFWAHVPDATDLGDVNPSALGLLLFLLRGLGVKGPLAVQAATWAWTAYAIAVLAASAPLLLGAHRLRDARAWVMSVSYLYVLLQPRPMAYGFLLLAPAALYFSPRPFDRRAGPLLLALILSAQGLMRLTSIRTDSPLVTYAPFLLSLCVWWLVLNERATTAGWGGAAPALRPRPASTRLD